MSHLDPASFLRDPGDAGFSIEELPPGIRWGTRFLMTFAFLLRMLMISILGIFLLVVLVNPVRRMFPGKDVAVMLILMGCTILAFGVLLVLCLAMELMALYLQATHSPHAEIAPTWLRNRYRKMSVQGLLLVPLFTSVMAWRAGAEAWSGHRAGSADTNACLCLAVLFFLAGIAAIAGHRGLANRWRGKRTTTG